MWEMEKAVLDEFVRSLGRVGGMVYLDFACGTGRVLSYLENRFEAGHGVDVSPSMLAVARANVRKATIYEIDITRVELFSPATFDVITAFRFFSKAESSLRDTAMGKLVQYLKPDGFLVFNNHKHLGSMRNRVKRFLPGGRVSGMSSDETSRLVARHGLLVDRAIPLGIWPGADNGRFQAIEASRALASLEKKVKGRHWIRSIANNLVYICKKSPA